MAKATKGEGTSGEVGTTDEVARRDAARIYATLLDECNTLLLHFTASLL